jgi:Zn-dependent protease with chaperone function
MRRALATVFTLGTLSSFVFAVAVGLMVAFGEVSLLLAAAAMILFNLLMLLVGPFINDLVYRWLYDLEWVTLDELRQRSPESAAVIEEVTADYGYDVPKLGIIPDRNPNAFTYGSARFNARVVVTDGCFEFLEDDELSSVVAHEMGHVTSRDFITMTIANTLVQLLYLVAIYSWRFAAAGNASSNKKGNAAVVLYGVAVLSYILWFFGEYIVLYLSRVREYAADNFAARYTHPDLLSNALVKIAYGIVTSDANPELSRATRNIGIMNLDDSTEEGLIYHNVRDEDGSRDLLLRSFLFDLKNPWARVMELKSTHPLTGKRVKELSTLPGATEYDFDDIERRFEVDRGRLYRQFVRDVAVLGLPVGLAIGFPLLYLGSVLFLSVPLSVYWLVGGWLVAIGIGSLALALYKYPRGDPEETTVVEEMANVYASPVRGRAVALDGELIGRGQAGYRFSADLMFKDRTGLMYLDYDHWMPFGNFLFSIRRVPELVGSEARVEGWFFRGTTQWVGMRRLHSGEETIKGYVHVGALAGGVVIALLGLLVAVVLPTVLPAVL